jgi:glycosyltransferase involved in cell wall biosynthesis
VRLVVDGRPLVGHRTGIGVHTAEILSRLDLDTPPVIASHAVIEDRRDLEGCLFDVRPMPLGVLWQQFAFAGAAERLQADVVWGPHGTLPASLRIPAIVSVHDLTSITLPAAHRLKTILSFNTFIGRSLDLARKIAAVSRTTADEVSRRFALPASKIEVVPNGVSGFFHPLPVPREEFILFAGTREPRKGLQDLATAWASLASPRPKLVIAGAAGWKSKELPGAEIAGYVTRDRLRDLYARCALFVYPSHYEGFGLPPLEAMACGAPVIAASGGAIPEVLGDAALLVPPGDPSALSTAMRRVLASRSLSEEMSAAGIRRAALFSWDRSAALFRELLEAVV